MQPGLEALIERNVSLPSPPGVAVRIVDLAKRPEVSVEELKSVLETDPALAVKVLRIANSPMYRQHREIESLSQAIIIMGFNATVSLALSFSLVSRAKGMDGGGLNHEQYWRRAFLSATAARIIAESCGVLAVEEVFLAALLQDIGMLAINRAWDGAYDQLGTTQADHHAVIDYEKQHFNVDHAEVGAWLLQQWHLPPRTVTAVGVSHDPSTVHEDDMLATFVRCVALSGHVADIFAISDADARPYENLRARARDYFGLEQESLAGILERTSNLIPEMEELFGTVLTDGHTPSAILEQAREALMERSLAAFQQVEKLQSTAELLREKARELEHASYRDPLTGVHNRRYIDACLPPVFHNAGEARESLSLAFVDLDKFKLVNDTHGHPVGDRVLKVVAERLKQSVREEDIVARLGGEEFVVIIPGANAAKALEVCRRIVRALNESPIQVSKTLSLLVTVSIGVATLEQGVTMFKDVNKMMKAADLAMYSAKQSGRNRVVAFQEMRDIGNAGS